MALIKEPLDINFFVEPLPLSDLERVAISKFIAEYKQKNMDKSKSKISKKQSVIAQPVQ
jgi:hypothetical protein